MAVKPSLNAHLFGIVACRKRKTWHERNSGKFEQSVDQFVLEWSRRCTFYFHKVWLLLKLTDAWPIGPRMKNLVEHRRDQEIQVAQTNQALRIQGWIFRLGHIVRFYGSINKFYNIYITSYVSAKVAHVFKPHFITGSYTVVSLAWVLWLLGCFHFFY